MSKLKEAQRPPAADTKTRASPGRDPTIEGRSRGKKAPEATLTSQGEVELLDQEWFAQRLIAEHGEDLLWTDDRRYIWDGEVWTHDKAKRSREWVRKLIDRYRHEAMTIKKELSGGESSKSRRAALDERLRVIGPALRLANARGYDAILDTARTPERRGYEEGFDRKHHLIVTPSEVYDIRCDVVLGHQRGELLTQSTRLDPMSMETYQERWQKFLLEVLGDAETIAYIQRAFGYSLTGFTYAKLLFLLTGPRDSGKSTLVNALANAAGDYASPFSFRAFTLGGQSAGHTDNLAGLRGVRFAFAHEAPPGKRLDAEGLKSFVSGDPIGGVSHKGEKGFTLYPCAKLWMTSNGIPAFDLSDAPLWSRVHVIECSNNFGRSSIGRAFLEPDFAATILQWGIEGAQMWWKDGIAAPGTVTDAVARAKASLNPLTDFLAERTKRDPQESVPTARLYGCYKNWAEVNGERVLSEKKVGLLLKEAGLTSDRPYINGKRTRVWKGIRML